MVSWMENRNADASGTYIDQVSRRLILPDLGVDAREIDPLVEPAANPALAGICNEVWEIADVFVVPWFQPITQITSIARFSPHSVRKRRNSRAG